jgi:hypothetical protein
MGIKKGNLPSNRKFCALLSSVFIFLAIHEYLVSGLSLKDIFFILATISSMVFGVLNLEIVTPLNKAWFLLGQILGKIVSPIVLGVIFFILITPIGFISRFFGRDALRLQRPNSLTYWVEPIGSNSDPESFKNQF